jgi:hypothetical protein
MTTKKINPFSLLSLPIRFPLLRILVLGVKLWSDSILALRRYQTQEWFFLGGWGLMGNNSNTP